MRYMLTVAVMAAAVLAQVTGLPAEEIPELPMDLIPVSSPVVEPVGPGEVNWSYQTIRATGMSVIDTALPLAQAKAMAIRGAKVDAQRNLLETVKGVRVVAETRVSDMMARNDYVYTRLDGIIKGARVVGEPRETGDGMVEVDMEVSIYEPGGVASPIAEEIIRNWPAEPPIQSPTYAEVPQQVYSSVVFDLTGTGLRPEMFPVLVDSTGQRLLDMTWLYQKLGPERFEQLRYVKSVSDLLADPSIMTNPAIVKITGALKQGWVVAQKDVDKVNWLKKGLDVLGKIGKAILMLL